MTHSATPSALRARILAMALVPSLLFVAAGLAGGWYLTGRAQDAQAAAALVVRKVDLTGRFVTAVLDERDAGVLGSAGDLSAARTRVDAAAAEVRSLAAEASAGPSTPLSGSIARMRDAVDGVVTARKQVQGGGLRGIAAYAAFEPTVALATGALAGSSIDGSDARIVAALDGAGTVLAAAGGVRDATVLAAQARGRALGPSDYPDLAAHAEGARNAFDAAAARLDGPRRDQVVALLATPQWRQFSTGLTTLLSAPTTTDGTEPGGAGGSSPAAPRQAAPAPVVDIDAPGATVAAAATDIAAATAKDAAAQQVAAADATLATITAVVLGAVAAAVIAMIIAYRTGQRLIRRLGRLRDDTVRTADQLPRLLDRLRDGEDLDVRAEIPELEHGEDEIGQVASAVTLAQRAAADAAGEEARTRAGANAVFLNIAHRSQALVHRQLQILDEAERAEDNSDQLARLYQLDHLTTRERRNAENLIIMGGRQPRRQWRRPVALADITRSAISESEQYTRITLGEVPAVYVDGAAVGDLIHLLAELVDNATSFSPPQCPIDVQAHPVGRGVVVEVLDRGLGIEAEPMARLNRMLAEPPDFGLMTLSDDSRLGMFVVSRLAFRHGIRVTLAESPYGGVQAIVLVPSAMLVEAAALDAAALDAAALDAAALDGTAPDGTAPDAAAPDAAAPATTPPPPAPGAEVHRNGNSGARSGGRPSPGPNGRAPESRAVTALAPEPEPLADPGPGVVAAPASPAVEAAVDAVVEVVAPAPEPPAAVADPVAEPPVAEPHATVAPQLPALPQLPERQPQVHLARELHEEPVAEDDTDDLDDDEPPVLRSRAAMSALQKGSRAARRGPEPGSNGDRP